jgi:rhodanese-related sulfurtransferase
MERLLLYSFLCLIPVAGISAQVAQADTCISLSADNFYLQLYDAGYPLLLDTRSRREFRKERIKGSVLAENRGKLDHICDTLDLDREIFIYCKHDYRSLEACEILMGKGFRKVYCLSGGLISWKLASYDVETKILRKKQE